MKDRIQLLVKALNYSAAQFADEIGVQKSGISHIISGRNNPSLDFIQKILLRFPEVSMDWLMFGKGPVFKDRDFTPELNENKGVKLPIEEEKASEDLFSLLEMASTSRKSILSEDTNSNLDFIKEEDQSIVELETKLDNRQFNNRIIEKSDTPIHSVSIDNDTSKETKPLEVKTEKKVERVLLFYADNTFREYRPE